MINHSKPQSKFFNFLKTVVAGALFVSVVLTIVSPAWASFIFSITPLDKTKISELSDEQLTSNYIDVLVEVDAVKTFYSKGGFTPKEYESFKDLLRYRIYLVLEFQKRKLELPAATSIFTP